MARPLVTREIQAGFCRQTNLSTENVVDTFTMVDAEVSLPSLPEGQVEIDRRSGQAFAHMPATLTHRAGSEFTVRTIVGGMHSPYDYTTHVPGVTPGVLSASVVLLGNAIGSNAAAATTADLLAAGAAATRSPYDDGDVAGATSTVIDVTTIASVPAGNFTVAGEVATDWQTGWAKTAASGVPSQVTLAHAAQHTAVAAEDLAPTATVYLSESEQHPLTWRLVGPASTEALILIGCVATQVELSVVAGGVLEATITYRATGWRGDSTLGGRQTVSEWPALPPLVARRGARCQIDGVTTELRDLKITITATQHVTQSHAGLEGEGESLWVQREVSVSFSARWDAADTAVLGRYPWQATRAGYAPFDLAVEVGSEPGALASIWLPSLLITDAVELSDVDGTAYWSVSAHPGAYSSDTATGTATLSAAANSLLRIGVA